MHVMYIRHLMLLYMAKCEGKERHRGNEQVQKTNLNTKCEQRTDPLVQLYISYHSPLYLLPLLLFLMTHHYISMYTLESEVVGFLEILKDE